MLLHFLGLYTHTSVSGEPAALLTVPKLHGVTSLQIIILSFTAMRTSSFTHLNFSLCLPLVFLSSSHYSLFPECVMFWFVFIYAFTLYEHIKIMLLTLLKFGP
jgi:hypothetical protein